MYKVFRPQSVDESMPPPDDQPGFVMSPTGLYVPVGQTWQGIITFDGTGVVLNNASLTGTTTIGTGNTLDDPVLTGNTVIEDLRLSDTVWDDLRFPAAGRSSMKHCSRRCGASAARRRGMMWSLCASAR